MNLSECSPAGEGEVRLVRHLVLSTEGFVPAKEREHWGQISSVHSYSLSIIGKGKVHSPSEKGRTSSKFDP